MITKETALKQIEALVQRFEEQIVSYKSFNYNEAQTRKDFIDPFFKALGWDMDNSQGNAEAYREVIHEDRVKVGAATKAPDYSFKLAGGKRLFFVEAKKPSVLVKEEVLPAYQVRRYAWSAKLPVSILTDFEEFAIYDCNKKPNATDKPSVGRIKYITYKEYGKEFDFIWDTFSKERVLKGSFDKFIAADKNKKGTATVDKEFLISLDEWRKQLALNIALRNEALTEDELNFVVQQTLDRIIFLRIAEDRGVEEYGRLKASLKGDNFYQNLFTYFREADSKYNSGLFDFKKDSVSLHVLVDNKTIKSVISELYYPASPYEFSVLSVEILGSAYEQFLGKQIKLTAGHRAVIEEKPEVRKAGGVYYTPQYIVEYIVENTVGKLAPLPLQQQAQQVTPAEVAKLKIVDPACGSGSFLLGAYQYLLNWHLQYYKPDFEKQTAIAQNSQVYTDKQRTEAIKERNKLPLTPDGHLTTALKKQILINNIYGVDIDTQAVEVTKLSLLLKCMEGETRSSITAEMRFGERILPTLDSNIKSGNSLIDMDFYDGQIDFEPALEKKVKPFSWQQGFPKVFKQGGFDAVIGNPPWGANLNDQERNYLSRIFELVPSKTKDTYFYFLFKSFKLINKNALIGLVLPNTWLLINNANLVRGYLLKFNLVEIIDYGDSVFKDAIVETSTIIIKNKFDENGSCQVKRYKKSVLIIDRILEKEIWLKDSLNRIVIDIDKKFDKFYEKILKESTDFSKNSEIIFGIKPYQIGHGKPPQTKDTLEKRIFHSDIHFDNSWKPLLTGTNINRYFLGDPQNQFIKYGEWLMYKSNEQKMIGAKIFLRRTSDTIRACYDDKSYYGQNSLFVITSNTINLKFLLAILNSSLINYIYKKKCPQVGKIFAEIKPSIIKELPIKKIDNQNKSEKSLHDEIVKLVETMLQLQQQKQTSSLPEQQQQLEQRIAYTDDKINEKVYALYGLSEEEVRVVEGR